MKARHLPRKCKGFAAGTGTPCKPQTPWQQMPVAPGPYLHDTVGLSRSAVGSGRAQLRLWDIFPASDLLNCAQPRCQGDGSLYVEVGFYFPAHPRTTASPSALLCPAKARGACTKCTRCRWCPSDQAVHPCQVVSPLSWSSRVSLAAIPSRR